MFEIKTRLLFQRCLFFAFIISSVVLINFLAKLGAGLFGLMGVLNPEDGTVLVESMLNAQIKEHLAICFEAFLLVVFLGMVNHLLYACWLTQAATNAAIIKPSPATSGYTAYKLFFGLLVPILNVSFIKRAFKDIRSRFDCDKKPGSPSQVKWLTAAVIASYLCVGMGIALWFWGYNDSLLMFAVYLLLCAVLLGFITVYLAAQLAIAVDNLMNDGGQER